MLSSKDKWIFQPQSIVDSYRLWKVIRYLKCTKLFKLQIEIRQFLATLADNLTNFIVCFPSLGGRKWGRVPYFAWCQPVSWLLNQTVTFGRLHMVQFLVVMTRKKESSSSFFSRGHFILPELFWVATQKSSSMSWREVKVQFLPNELNFSCSRS